jgi:quercetin dioxygenase-like cupin family protein
MSDKQTYAGHRSPRQASGTHQIFSPERNLRPSNQFLTELTDDDSDYSVMLCTLPAGLIVPLHSHADRETFYILTGQLDVFHGDHWKTLGPGDAVDLKDGIQHAWKNSFDSAASMLCITTMRLARFLRDIAVNSQTSDPTTAAKNFLKLVREHGYWLANPEANAAIGLRTNWERAS